EKIVPNSIVADGAHAASDRLKNARRTYWPISPGTIANACVDPSTARSAPMSRDRTANDRTAGVTTIHAAARAVVLSHSRAPVSTTEARQHLATARERHEPFVDRFDFPHPGGERQLALDPPPRGGGHLRRQSSILQQPPHRGFEPVAVAPCDHDAFDAV